MAIVGRVGKAALAGILFLAVGAAAGGGEEDEAAWFRANFTKFEVRIEMRDGARLFTSIYVPNDRTRTRPILLQRTPYSVRPYGADEYPEKLGHLTAYAREGYILAFQDVRGRNLSEGEFVNMRPHLATKVSTTAIDESTDTWDTVEWLVRNVPANNGRVGLHGISYPGFYAAAGAIDSHPALKAVSPQAPIADWYFDDFHHHGTFSLAMAFHFFHGFGRTREEPGVTKWEKFDAGTPDGYRFFLELGPLRNVEERYFRGEVPFWTEVAAHPDYDAFWRSRNLLPHLRNVRCAVLTVGGWFDAEDLYGPLHVYRAIEDNNPGTFNVLVMGPWFHGAWNRDEGESLGEISFGFPTSRGYRENVERPFFRHWLEDGPAPALAEATVFETGANRWREFGSWPPREAEARTLYLGPEGMLRFEPPSEESGEASDPFPSDPARPVPYTAEVTQSYPKSFMTEDQRFASRRPDVLVYETAPLDGDLTVAGPLEAALWVSTTGADADWIVKLVDAHPGDVEGKGDSDCGVPMGGYEMLVRAEAFRGRYRNGYDRPEPFEPGAITRLTFPLQDVLHTFRKGHRIQVQIQSSFFPFLDRNPQTWVANVFEAEASDFRPAVHRVHRSVAHPSGLRLAVVPPPLEKAVPGGNAGAPRRPD